MATEGGIWAPLWGSFTFQHFGRLASLLGKSPSPWRRRGPAGVWVGEEEPVSQRSGQLEYTSPSPAPTCG